MDPTLTIVIPQKQGEGSRAILTDSFSNIPSAKYVWRLWSLAWRKHQSKEHPGSTDGGFGAG